MTYLRRVLIRFDFILHKKDKAQNYNAYSRHNCNVIVKGSQVIKKLERLPQKWSN